MFLQFSRMYKSHYQQKVTKEQQYYTMIEATSISELVKVRQKDETPLRRCTSYLHMKHSNNHFCKWTCLVVKGCVFTSVTCPIWYHTCQKLHTLKVFDMIELKTAIIMYKAHKRCLPKKFKISLKLVFTQPMPHVKMKKRWGKFLQLQQKKVIL